MIRMMNLMDLFCVFVVNMLNVNSNDLDEHNIIHCVFGSEYANVSVNFE